VRPCSVSICTVVPVKQVKRVPNGSGSAHSSALSVFCNFVLVKQVKRVPDGSGDAHNRQSAAVLVLSVDLDSPVPLVVCCGRHTAMRP
jgi:hypothetical protein